MKYFLSIKMEIRFFGGNSTLFEINVNIFVNRLLEFCTVLVVFAILLKNK